MYMPFFTLQSLVYSLYAPALMLRDLFPREKRERYRRIVALLTALAFMCMVVAFSLSSGVLGAIPLAKTIATLFVYRIAGIFLILVALLFVESALEAFYRSYYFRGLTQTIQESTQTQEGIVEGVGWGVATIVAETNADDVVRAFLESGYGQEVLYRAGVHTASFSEYFAKRVLRIRAESFHIVEDKRISLAVYAKSIYEQDAEFQALLAKNTVSLEHLVHAGRWVTALEQAKRKQERWWSRDSLGRIQGFGKTWGYGKTYLLERHGHDLVYDHVWESSRMSIRAEDDEVEDMEHILARARQENVLLIGNDAFLMRTRVAQLYHKIRRGEVLSPLEAKRIFMLDIESMLIEAPEKTLFEALFIRTLNQAVSAGNCMLYIEHLGPVLVSTRGIGVDFFDMLGPYCEADTLQIIIGCSEEHFEAHVAHDTRVLQFFDVVRMRGVALEGMLSLLEQRAYAFEMRTGVVCTIPALMRTLALADRYFPTGVMPDKALDLIEELVPHAYEAQVPIIDASFVDEFVHTKTNIPVGEPDSEERQKLLSLEETLQERVVGQDEALRSLARTLRRTRAGLGDPKKLLGSFLFLGPTGVGKTETAKALAHVFFGSEQEMSRLDMTEFQGMGALEELIGVQGSSLMGRLESLVGKRQYGVLLLDEFEKAHRTVHDLFLQILDEGMFTTASGKVVGMHNLLIIATSNAGAELLWKWAEEGKDANTQKETFLNHILSEGLFRPELLNRFDDIILFNVLQREHIRTIAIFRLNALRDMLFREHGITLSISDGLVDALVQLGYDPRMGGRPLNRALKEHVEQRVADKLLQGVVHAGDTLSLTPEEVLAP